ncbi:hypothetical protein EBR77_03580, partial [bacterium]|nr:hypothetical protein [bacterium]
MKNMFLIMVLGLSVQLVCAADLDTHRDMSFDRSMKGGTAAPAGQQDPVVGKLDPRGLGVRNFVILHDFESEILEAKEYSNWMISEQITWDLYTFLQSQDLVVCMTPNLLTNILCNIQFVKDIQRHGDRIEYQYPWSYFNKDMITIFKEMYRYIQVHIDIKNIQGDADLDFTEDFYNEFKAKYPYSHALYTFNTDTQLVLPSYATGIFLGLLAEPVLEKWDFYTIAKTQYLLGIPKKWSENNSKAIQDAVGGLAQRQNMFIKAAQIQSYNLYDGIVDVAKNSQDFKKIDISGNFMEMYRHPFFVVQDESDTTFQDLQIFFEKFFISQRFVDPKYTDYASFVLPSWNILISGHGSEKEETSGLPNREFKDLLDLFSKHLIVRSFSYLSCYPAGEKFKELFIENSKDLRLKKYNFPILSMGSTLATTASKQQGSGVEGLYDRFFWYVSQKQYARAMDSVKFITGSDVGNVYMLKDVRSDRFVPIRFDESTSVPLDSKSTGKKFKKNTQDIMYTSVMDATKKKFVIDAQKTRGIFLQTHDIQSPIDIVRYDSKKYPATPVFIPQAQSGDTEGVYMNVFYHFASLSIDTIEPNHIEYLFNPSLDNPNKSDVCVLIDRLEIKNYGKPGQLKILNHVVYIKSKTGIQVRPVDDLLADQSDSQETSYGSRYEFQGKLLTFEDSSVIYKKKQDEDIT